jgi:hypothetical protein
VRMTTTNTTSLSRSGDRQHQIASLQTYRELPGSSLYRHLLHDANELALNFVELLVAARFICSFTSQNYWFFVGEMQI